MPYDPAQVYQPEADTFLLLAAAQAEVKPGDRVLEIGTGSGSIAAALVQDCDIVATDINPHAIFCARGERTGCGAERSLFRYLRGTFDLIIFNPPYLPTQPDERIDDWLEYALDGGATGPGGDRAFRRYGPWCACPGGKDPASGLLTDRALRSCGVVCRCVVLLPKWHGSRPWRTRNCTCSGSYKNRTANFSASGSVQRY